MQLDVLMEQLSHCGGVRSKQAIQFTQQALNEAYTGDYPLGDDTAAIPNQAGGYDLFACEGFLSNFVAADPWFAGWCGVMVNVSDIAAMGGVPTAVVNAFWGKEDATSTAVFEGMKAAAAAYNVPIVGGHTNMSEQSHHLSVSILGRAKRLLTSFDAKPCQVLVAAVDLRGAFREPFDNWNAAVSAPPERLREDLNILPTLAEEGLATACKDISQAGLLGTAAMLAEASGVGFAIDLTKVPKPAMVSWYRWLRCFPSYGYLLAVDSEHVPEVTAKFKARDIAAAAIGMADTSSAVHVRYEQSTALFMNTERYTGFNHAPVETLEKELKSHA